MPDKRYSLKVNGQSRTVKADVFNQNIDKFVNDMPDATITMTGRDGNAREYRLRDIAEAYDSGYSFAETDTPIYVNPKPQAKQPTQAPASQEAAQVQQPAPQQPYTGQTVNAEDGYIFTEAGLDSLQKGATPVAVPSRQATPQPPFFTADNPSPLQPQEPEKVSLTPFADRVAAMQQQAQSGTLNNDWKAAKQQEADALPNPNLSFGERMDAMQQSQDVEAARKMNRSKFDEQHFDDFFDKKVAGVFSEERGKGQQRAAEDIRKIPKYDIPGAQSGFARLFETAMAWEKHTDPEKIAGSTLKRVEKDDSFGDYVLQRMGVDPNAESEDGARVPQLSQRETDWLKQMYAVEMGEVADKIVQRMYDQYRAENTPRGVLDYILGKAFHENLAASLFSSMVQRAAHSSGMREQLRAMASQQYGQDQSWAVRVAGGAAPFAVDMVAGGFALPNLIGKAAVKGGTRLAAREVTKKMAERAAARGLEGAALKEAVSGGAGIAERYLATQAPILNLAVRSAGSAANFATYDMQGEIVRQIGEGEFKPFDLMKEAVHGATVGAVMGGAGGAIGHATRNAGRLGKIGGGIAGLGAETTIFGVSSGLAKAQAEGEDISSVDWADTMGEAFGQVVGMKAVGAAMHPREFLNRYRKSKDYDLQMNQRDLDELKRAGYDFDGVFKGLGKFGETAPEEATVINRAKEYTPGAEGTGSKRETTSEEAWVDADAYEAIMRNPEISSSTKRKIAYIATGRVLMPEPVFGATMEVGEDGRATITTTNAYGNVIETKDYKAEEEARKDYEQLQGVSRRNTIDGLERIAGRAGFDGLVDAAKGRTLNETGADVDDVLTGESEDRAAADAVLDNYIKNLQEAYMERFNEKLKQLGGKEGANQFSEGPQPEGTGGGLDNAGGEAGVRAGTGGNNPSATPPPSGPSSAAPPPAESAGPSPETLSRRDAAYNRGAGVVDDKSVLPVINYEVKLADARMAALFPSTDANAARFRSAIMNAVEEGNDEEADRIMQEQGARLTPEQREAVETYRDLMESQRGVEDAVTQQTEDYQEQRTAELETLTAQDGTITPLELADGTTVYYKSGNIDNKYGGIIVADENGQQKQIPTSSVKKIGEKHLAVDIIAADVDAFAADLTAGYEGIANGSIFIPGASVDMMIGGKPFTATVAGQDAAENPVFKLADGSMIPMSPQDARNAIGEADRIKIQMQLQDEAAASQSARRTERFQKGIKGYSEGRPDYTAPESDPQAAAEYLLSTLQDGDTAGRGKLLKNVQGEKDLLKQNEAQTREEWQRAQNVLDMSEGDARAQAKAIQDIRGAQIRIEEIAARQRKWGQIRQTMMNDEERRQLVDERTRAIGKAKTASKKEYEAQVAASPVEAAPIPTGQELLAQYQEQREADAAVEQLKKETQRAWRDDLFPRIDEVRKMLADYQNGLTEYTPEELKQLTDALTAFEAEESALIDRQKKLKELGSSLGRLYAPRNNAGLTPHEKKVNALAKTHDRAKKMQLAREAYNDDPMASAILEDTGPQDVYEVVAANLGYGTISWESYERGTHHVRGLQEELGKHMTRGFGKDSDTYGFNAYLAATGEGKGIDEVVHDIYESQPEGNRYDTEEIKNALLDMLMTAKKPTDISHRIEDGRIAAAEQIYQAGLEREREELDAEAAERQKDVDGYLDYLDTLRSLIPTEEVQGFISGLMADEVAAIEQERMTYEDALRQMMPDDDNQTNITDETGNEQRPAAPDGGRVDSEPQPAAVEGRVDEGQAVVQAAEPNQQATGNGDSMQPAPDAGGTRTGVSLSDADRGVSVSPEAEKYLKESLQRIDKAIEAARGAIADGTFGEAAARELGDILGFETGDVDGAGSVVAGLGDEFDPHIAAISEGVEAGIQRRTGTAEPRPAEQPAQVEQPAEQPPSFAARLEAAKAETDTNPTEAQKKAGNYKMGHIKFGGYSMSIENPKGGIRSGRDADGKEWSITMHDTYGYIGRKYGTDGDHLDFFINDDADLDTWNGRVFVIDQKNTDGTFDEHKVMYGYPSWIAARKAYEANYEPGWWDGHVMQMMGVMKGDFGKWLADSDHKTKPFADYRRTQMADTVSDPASDLLATVAERQEQPAEPKNDGPAVKPLGEHGTLIVGGVRKHEKPAVQQPEQEPQASAESEQRDALVDIFRKAGIEVNLVQREGQQVLDDANGDYSGIKFQKVTDPKELEQLESGPTEVGYRNVVLNDDGSFGSPMAGTLGSKGKGKKSTSPFEMQQWERSDEHPELVDENGKINLGKPDNLGNVDKVDYNPYIHIRPDLVNKQFKNAWERRNLVYVKVAYPASELTSGYHAEKAKLPVGKHPWNGGELILSRWSKTLEITPWEQVADDWVKAFNGRGVEFDIVPPKLLPILQERGVEILPPHKRMSQECYDAYDAWKNGDTAGYEAAVRASEGQRGIKADPEEAYKAGVDVSYTDKQGRKLTMRIHTAPSAIAKLKPEKIKAHTLTRDQQKTLYQSFQPETNASTGEQVEFFNSAFEKNHREGGLFEKIVPQIRKLYKGAILIYSEPENLGGTLRPDGTKHKEHRDINCYGNYLNRATIDGKEYYVRFTVQRKKGESGLHSSFVSNVELYNKENPAKVAYGLSHGEGRLDFDRISDAKLQIYFEKSKEIEERFPESGEIRYFRTTDGEVYGYVKDGKIYLDPEIAESEHALHEYAHLWTAAMQRENPEEWQNIVGIMKRCVIWESVKRDHPDLETDDDIADEVVARYSGRRGRRRLEQERQRIIEEQGSASEKEQALGAIDRLKEALKTLWSKVADFLNIHYKTADEVADRIIRDALHGVNPNETRRERKESDGPGGGDAEPEKAQGYEIEPRFHKKKGINIYAVKFEEKFDREKFLELKKQVKDFGGYYSSFGKGGFIFEGDVEDARRFAESVTKGINDEKEQRTAADTAAITSDAETIAVEADALTQAAVQESTKIAEAVSKIDEALDKVNKQLALLGYYEAGDDVPFHESYGYMRSAEKKALKDANDLARKIGAAIGYDVSRKQVAKANLAPIGGDISIHLPFSEGKEVYVNIMLDNESDNLCMRSGYFRVDGTGKPGWYGINQFFEPSEPLDRLLQRIESEVYYAAPEYVIKQIAQKGAKPKTGAKAKPQPSESLMGDLFAQQMPETAQQQSELERGKQVVRDVLDGRPIESDAERDTLQQFVDEGKEAAQEAPLSDAADKAVTDAATAVREYDQKKVDDYQQERSETQKPLFPKDGEQRIRERVELLRMAQAGGNNGDVRRLLGEIQDLFIWKWTDEGVGLMEQMERWKEYEDSLKDTKDVKNPSEVANEPGKGVSLQPDNEPINDKNDERATDGSPTGEADDAAVGPYAIGTDGGVQAGGTGAVSGIRGTGGEPTGNRGKNVGRKRRPVEAGGLFDAGDFGDTTEPATGGVRTQPAGGADGGAADGRGRQDGGSSPRTASKPEGAAPVAQPTKPAEPSKRADDGSVKTAAEKARPLNTRNYLFPKDAGQIDNMSPRERLKTNVRALEILRDVLHEGRDATPEECAELGKFRGWGGIEDAVRWYNLDDLRRVPRSSPWGPPKSTEESELKGKLADIIEELDPDGKRNLLGSIRDASMTSYYTPVAVATSINGFFERAGYKGGGSFLDGSMGSGVLEGTMPKAIQQRTQIYGTELDWLTGQIAKQLYPDANIKIQGFQDIDLAPGSVDLAGSNIPFGDIKVYDKSWGKTSDPVKRAAQQRIHNYFTVKKIELVKPGGLLYIMTSNAIMDTKSNQIIRQYIADQCEILGAMRLPDNTFKGAGTKVVTDVIFLRKYKDGEDATATRQGDYLEKVEKPFLSTTSTEAQGRYETYEVTYNGYYGEHPDMMIGEVKAGGQYRDDEFGLTSQLSTEEIAKKMDGLLKKRIVPADRAGKLYDTHRTERQSYQAIRESYTGDGNYVSNGNIVEQNGKLGVIVATKGGSDFQEVPGLKAHAAKIRAMIPLRTAMKELIAREIGGESVETLKELRGRLQQAYNNYYRKFGRLQDKASQFIANDIDGYTLMSLEKWKDGKFVGLGDIFTKSTIKPRLNLDNATTPSELITVSLAEYGEIRPSFMEERLGENWLEQCGDVLFEIPFRDRYQIKDLYLSGDVKSKLEDAERAAKSDPRFERNVEALKAVVPKDIPFVGISIHMGARWVPEHVYTEFVCDLLGISDHNPKTSITYMPEADQFQVYVSDFEMSGKAKDYETPHRSVTQLLEAALKNDKVKITVTDRDGGTVFLEAETNSANDKIQDIREKFEDWLSKDRDRVKELEQLYNDRYNRTVIPHYDGSHLQVPGLQGMELRPHQKDAVWMLINNRGGIIDHIVGAGKTLVMQASIMEMRRMGIAKKPMIIALKATVPQMAAEFRQAFPAARILAPTEKDFAKDKRKRLLSNIALNDWDCVILSHEQYGMLPHTEDIETGVFREQLDQLESAIALLHGGGMSQMTKKQLKGLEKRKKSLEAKMQKLLDRKVDREFCFENLGVDYLFVDECQQFKSLPYVTTHQNVKGLASPEGSGRATALLCGARYLQQLHQGDTSLVLLSGTTISNSLVELYSLFQYVRPNKLAELGFSTFDAWAANFAECSSELEYNHTNELVMSSRFRTFDNVPELAKLYTEVADVRNDMNLKLPKPKMKVHEVIVPASDALAKIAEECAKMCKSRNGSYFGIPDKTPSGKEQPWALLATNISTKAAINVKLVDTSLDDGDGGKIRYVCDNVKEIYEKFKGQKGTQMIFCDLGVPGPDKEYDVYNDIINRLVEDYGIPREQIVDIHTANTDAKKKALFKKMNDGDVRVLIAGAKNGGTGVNVQKRLIAIHHVDMSWNPANIIQENGRGARQGNWLAKEYNDDNVEIYYYATEKSLDLYKYQLVSSKQAMIDKFKTGATSDERSFDEGEADDDSGFSPASIVALLSGNPIIMEKAKMDKKVEKLIKSKRQYMVEHEQKVYDYQHDQQHLKNFENLVERNKKDLEVLEQHGFKPGKEGVYPATVTIYSDKDPSKTTFNKPTDAGKRIHYLVNSGDKVTLEGFGMTATIGFPEETLDGKAMVRSIRLNTPSGITYKVELSNDDTAAGTSLRRLLKQVIDNGKKYADNAEHIRHKLEGGDPGKPHFPKEEELQAMLEEKKRIDAEYAKLSADKQDNAPEGETMKRRGEGAVLPPHTDREFETYRRTAIETAEQLGGTEVHLDQRSAESGVKGWFDTGDNSVHVVMDAIEGVEDLKRTIFHEKLGHEGLKALFGGSNKGVDQFGQFLFGSAGKKLRQRIIERADREGYGWDDPLRFSKAAQEVFADIAEAGPRTKDEFSLWRKVKHHLIDTLNKKGLRIPGILNDHDLRYYVLKTGEALKKWDGMSAEAQAEAGNRMYSRAGKPRKRKDESMAQYLQRLRSWEKWRIAEEASRAAGDPQPDKEAIDKQAEADYKAALDAWKQANGIQDGTNGPGAFPKREPGETPQEYALRVADYETRADAWKGAPSYFDFMQRANEEYREQYEAWKARYDLTEAASVDMDLYEGKGGDGPVTDADVEAESRVEREMAEAVGVAVDSDGAKRQAKMAVIDRRKNLESSNAEDAIWLYNLRKKIDEVAAQMSERTGEAVTGQQLREALPFIIEGTYFEDVLRDENGNVVSIEDISDQLPIKKGPELDALLADIKEWYDEFYQTLEDAGLRYDAGYIAEGYVNHVWDKGKSDPKAWEQYVENYQRTKSPNMRHREIDTYREGIDIGLVPKYTDICDIMAHYSRQNNEAVANKKLLEDLSFIVVQEVNGDGEVVANWPLLDSSKPAFGDDKYVMYHVPGVGDVWVLKDIQKRFATVFGTMRTQDAADWLSKFGKGYDLVGSTAKKIQLALSGFHALALWEVDVAQSGPVAGLHDLLKYVVMDSYRTGTIPAYAHPGDFKEAAKHLVQLGATEDYAASDVNAITATFREKMKEWVESDAVMKKAAGTAGSVPAIMLDWINKGFDTVLWNYLHDGLKIASFKRFAEQIDARVNKEGLSEEQREKLLDEAGQYVNDTFGGQYWELLNVSPATLKWLRRAFLSPDWLISTQRHFLANFGIGSLYNDGGFREYLKYNRDNLRRLFGADVARNEERRFRSRNAKMCYLIGALFFWQVIYNALNALNRWQDEQKEAAKAEEIRQTNPSYKSPYELAYPDGMKWYDYTMFGNSVGHQTHLFTGRYEDGTETYARWGKQFREFPELFIGRHGFEFPSPVLERMQSKANPVIGGVIDALGSLDVNGFKESYQNKELREKYGKSIAAIATTARHFMPFGVPTQADKEYKWLDFFMPSSKGFSRYKAVDYFKTFILAGDMRGVEQTYNAAVMNGVDAEACLKSAISTLKATQRKEMADGVVDLQSAMEKYDAAEGEKQKSVLKNKIVKYLAAERYRAYTRDEAVEQVNAFLEGEGITDRDNDRYIELSRSEDVRDDYRLNAIGKQAKQYVDKVKTCDDPAAQQQMSHLYGSWFAINSIVGRARRDISGLKKQLGNGHDVEVMEQIRQIRRQAQEEIDHLEPPM